MQSSEWERLLLPLFEGTNYELFGIEYHSEAKRPILRVFIDKEGGIGIDDISKMSKEISIFLDVEAEFADAYTLEVSSPGLDRTLFKPKHYLDQVGQLLSVKLNLPVDGRRNFKGKLESAGSNTFTLSCEDNTYCFAYHSVEKAKIIPQYPFGTKNERQNDE